ncbi:MAG: hypothetical protein QOF51_4113 [Chloroflexota bacterium]|jgi:SAM-dependent methyltransferase|nr:hypothetical protein [Chloroflexota bacterium]
MDAPVARASDRWNQGSAYEPFIGRWSRLVAVEFLSWLGLAPGGRWLDVGCGTGALTATILEQGTPSQVKGIDPAPAFAAFARAQLTDPRAAFAVGEAQQLPELDASYDAVVAGLVLNFVPEPARALEEMSRVVRPGGTVAGYVWDYAGGMELLRYFWDAAAALDPQAGALDEGQRFPLCAPAALTDLFRDAGLHEVEAWAIEVPTVFRDFADYWNPFLGGQGPAPGYALSLSDDRRATLRQRLERTLPIASDGMIRLTARAWAVRGQR